MITIISGWGRCFSNLVMNMLLAAGVDVITGARELRWPYLEDRRATKELDAAKEWLKEYEGRAVKMLNPFTHPPPTGLNCRAIWLDRDETDVATSWYKFWLSRDPKTVLNHKETREQYITRVATNFRVNKPRALQNLQAACAPGWDVLVVDGKNIVETPEIGIGQICVYLSDLNLDPRAMDACILPRKAGVGVEDGMLEEWIEINPPPWVRLTK